MRKNLACIVFAAFGAGCGGGDSNPDAGVLVDAVGAQEAAAAPLPYCTSKPALPSVTDLSGTWVARLAGAQIVTAPIVGTMHILSVYYVVLTIDQRGTDLVADGRYCDRTEIDPPGTLAPVVIPDAWAHTETPVHRTGGFATGLDGFPVLTIDPFTEVVGALASSADALPSKATDRRLVDQDGDGNPGITIVLNGQSIFGSIYSVQQQTTSVSAIAVAPTRVEGELAFSSKQNVLGSDPATIAALYAQSKTSPDPEVCNGSFVMVKLPDALIAGGGAQDGGDVDGGEAMDGGTSGCAWVRANEAALFQ